MYMYIYIYMIHTYMYYTYIYVLLLGLPSGTSMEEEAEKHTSSDKYVSRGITTSLHEALRKSIQTYTSHDNVIPFYELSNTSNISSCSCRRPRCLA